MMLPGKRPQEHDNHERWLVSYADFITLLFAFFVLLYASSNNNPAKMQMIEDSIRTQMSLDGSGGSPAFNHTPSLSKSLIKNPTKPAPQKKQIDELAGNVGDPALEAIKQEMVKNKELQDSAAEKRFQKNLDIIKTALKDELEAHIFVLNTQDREITLFINGKSTFGAGQAKMKKDFDQSFQKLVKTLDDVKGQVKISGHSDLDRIPASSSYQNQLELSSARATQMASELIQSSKTLEDRITVESFGATRPINKGGSAYDNVSNSRIEITIHQK